MCQVFLCFGVNSTDKELTLSAAWEASAPTKRTGTENLTTGGTAVAKRLSIQFCDRLSDVCYAVEYVNITLRKRHGCEPNVVLLLIEEQGRKRAFGAIA